MPVIKQTLDKVCIGQLKALKDIELDFNDKKVTAIFGINGCGKSTILHALACLYRPHSKELFYAIFQERKSRDLGR